MDVSTDTERLLSNEGNRCGFWRKFSKFFNSDNNGDIDDTEPVSWIELFRFASRGELAVYGVACILNLLIGLVTPAYIYVIGRLATVYIEEKSPIGNEQFLWRVWKLASLYCVSSIVCFVLEFVQHYLLTWTSEKIATKCRSRFVRAILERDSTKFKTSSGELSSQLTSHIDRMREGLGDRIGLFVKSISSFVSCCVFSFVIDWQTALFLVWCGPIYILSAALIPKLSKSSILRTLAVSEGANGISEECILNVKTVASCNGQKQMIERYAFTLDAGVSAAVKAAFASGFLDATTNLLYFSFNSFGIWFATISYHEGRVPVAGDVFAVVHLALAGAKDFSRLGPSLVALMKARIAASKIYQTIESVKTQVLEHDSSLLDPDKSDLHLEFRNVSFSFPSRSMPILDGLSFSLFPGKSLGLVGKSGSGKSTTVKLLTRFLETEMGQILLDGVSLCKYDKKQWRNLVGVVSQEPCIFAGSIRENICLGRSFTDREVEAACRIAHAHDFIGALDKGYDTLLGSSGVSLSGGQKQRIAIARAIASNPRLLLLDEATSALDTKSERIVQEALDSAAQGRSTIVIAHRLSTIKNVDQVIVMDRGRIVEYGAYDELRSKPDGIFSRMITEQELERRKSDVDNIDFEDHSSFNESFNEESVDENIIDDQREEQLFPSISGGLMALLSRNKWTTFIVIFVGLLRGVASPLFALRYLFVFGSLEDDDYETLLFWLMMGTMAVGVYNFACQLLSQPINQYIGETVMNKLRVSCLRSLLHRPISYFDRQSTSPAACAILLSQQPPMAMAMVDNKLAIVVDGLFGCIALLIMTFAFCGPTGFVGFFYLFSYIVILIVFEKFSDRAYKEVVEADKSGEVALEIFDNVATIQQIAVERHFQEKFDGIINKREGPLLRKMRYQSLVHATNESIFYFFDFLATAIGVYFVYLGYYGPKLLFLAENMLSTVGYKTAMMSDCFKEMVSASSAAKLLFSLIDPELEKSGETPSSLREFRGSVSADSLTFAYPSQPNTRVINDVSFRVEQARSIAFVGPSGSGKSTIVNLLERYYDPNSGELMLDDTPFTSLTPSQLRSNIALVSQEPILFRGTIADNIRLGMSGVSEEEVKGACRRANAAEFIHDLPEGYNTLVGEKGRSLSGGQKQRIAIARALVRNPRVIILDEATSALDTQSEKVVRAALENSAQGRTSVMIAHRLETITHCDEICFVEGGRIVERGSDAELIRMRGKYYEMTQHQKLD